jgi:hypothetical protein
VHVTQIRTHEGVRVDPSKNLSSFAMLDLDHLARPPPLLCFG